MAVLTRTLRGRWLRSPAPLLLVPVLIAGAGRWGLRPSTGPEPRASIGPMAELSRSTPAPPPLVSDCGKPPVWPDVRLEGEPAKRLLLAFVTVAGERLDRIGTYTALLLKRERLGGKLGLEETMEVKVRHHPFAVYLKYRGRKQGREVLYAEGCDENKLVAHAGDWTSRLIPRLKLDPTSSLAMIDNRHPITEAGLAHLAKKLEAACRMDLGDPGVMTVLDKTTEAGRPWLRSVQTYTRPSATRTLSRVEVCYDVETGFPLRFSGEEWPEPGKPNVPRLGESYRYDDLRLEAGLSQADFDSQNPAYAFAR